MYYPKTTQPDVYHTFMRQGGGYGGLFSILLRDMKAARAFYDALDVYKGPSLGTNYTLSCPYTLLVSHHPPNPDPSIASSPSSLPRTCSTDPLRHVRLDLAG